MGFIKVSASYEVVRQNTKLMLLLGNHCLVNNNINEKSVPNPTQAYMVRSHKSLSFRL
jgi:hypothetical protein